ncbi:MAG: hypothetical protein Q7R95_08440 [bacterium]|nr:hypothetical protein [bacterium]
MNNKIYIGVVGQIAVGKGKLVEYLIDKCGFTSFSLSSLLHKELQKRGIINFTRKTLQDLGDELRKQYGDAVLAKRAIKMLSVTDSVAGFPPVDAHFVARRREPFHPRHLSRVVIEGIRNPAEIELLKKIPHFVLIGVKAKRELRFKRLLERAKPWDPKDWKTFLEVDRRDLGIGQKKSGQQVGKCLAYCDYILTNNKDVCNFHMKVEKLIAKILI